MSKISTLSTLHAQIAGLAPARAAEDAAVAERQAQERAALQSTQAAELQAIADKRATEDSDWSTALAAVRALPDDLAPDLDPSQAAA